MSAGEPQERDHAPAIGDMILSVPDGDLGRAFHPFGVSHRIVKRVWQVRRKESFASKHFHYPQTTAAFSKGVVMCFRFLPRP